MVTDRLFYIVQSTDEGREVQSLLKERLNIASGMIKVLKYNKGILLDGEVVRGTATVAAGPGVKPGHTIKGYVREVDVAPTAAVLLGVDIPKDCEGAPAYQIFTERM